VNPRSGRETGRRVVVEKPSDAYPRDSSARYSSASLVRAGRHLWLADRATKTVVEVDPITATVVRRVDIGGDPRFVAVGTSGLWVIDGRSRPTQDGSGLLWRLARIDPAAGTVAQEVLLGPGLGSAGPVELAIGDGTALTSWPSGGRTRRNGDLASGAVSSVGSDGWEMATRGAAQVTAARGGCSVEITDTSRGLSSRTVPMLTGRPACLPRAVALGPGQTVWAAYLVAGKPSRLVGRSLRSARARSYPVGENVVELVADGGPYIWALSRSDHRVTRIRANLEAVARG
jgi:hypothetical protein